LGCHRRAVTVDREHATRCDPAALEHAKRLGGIAGAEQADPGVDAEDVEVVVRHAAIGNRSGEELPGPSRPPPEALVEMRREAAAVNALEQRAPHPVRLDYAGVERIFDTVRAGDQLQVRPRSFEASCELDEAPVGHARLAVLEQRPVFVRAAVTECVRGIGVARE
jgi:hypothetical protein